MITIRVFNLNTWDIETELNLDLKEKLVSDINDKLNQLDMFHGIKARIDFLEVSNYERFYEWLLRRIYPGYKVFDFQHSHPKGTPDFNLIKDKDDKRWDDNSIKDYGDEFRLEIKRESDKLSFNQMDWIFQNKHKNQIKIMLIKEKIPFSDK